MVKKKRKVVGLLKRAVMVPINEGARGDPMFSAIYRPIAKRLRRKKGR